MSGRLRAPAARARTSHDDRRWLVGRADRQGRKPGAPARRNRPQRLDPADGWWPWYRRLTGAIWRGGEAMAGWASDSDTVPVVVIQPSSGWALWNLGELWAYRELLYFLVWRDIKVRYKQTVLGAAWAVLQPSLTMVVFTIFFGRLAQVRLGRSAVPDLFLRCAAAVDVLRPGPRGIREQRRRLGEPDHQGLLPAADHPGCGRGGRHRRLRDRVRPSAPADGVLPRLARPGGAGRAAPGRCWPSWRRSARDFGWPPSTPSTATCGTSSRSSCRCGCSSRR